jgi:hypothetical protein
MLIHEQEEHSMRTARLIAGLTLLLGVVGHRPLIAQFRPAAQAPMRYADMDRDRDGVITLREWLYANLPGLDRNGDGTIQRSEWQAAFDQQDPNRDGAITRRELDGAPDPVPPARPPQPQPRVRTFDVDPRVPWVFSGFTVERDQTLVVSVEGSVQLSEDENDTALAAGSQTGRRAPNSPMPAELAGALIGRIGNSRPFAIGDQIQIITPAAGELFLGVNDDALADNRGRFRVRIAVK